MYIGVDIGGSHITAAQVNIEDGEIITSSIIRSKLNPHASSEEILTAWANAIVQTSNQRANYYLGIAMPGPFDYENGICLMKNVNKYESLYGLNIRNELSERLSIPIKNISFRNDSEAFLEGEMLFGAGQQYEKAIGITMGTGLGTSIYHEGDAKDMAMGINHQLLEGVAEDYISTRWFVKRYHELTGKTVDGAKQLVESIENDEASQEVFTEFAKNVCLFIDDFTKIFHPELIIVGGNIAGASPLFFPAVEKMLSENTHKIQLIKSSLNEQAALMGAVGLWKKQLK